MECESFCSTPGTQRCNAALRAKVSSALAAEFYRYSLGLNPAYRFPASITTIAAIPTLTIAAGTAPTSAAEDRETWSADDHHPKQGDDPAKSALGDVVHIREEQHDQAVGGRDEKRYRGCKQDCRNHVRPHLGHYG